MRIRRICHICSCYPAGCCEGPETLRLLDILRTYVPDKRIRSLIAEVVVNFHSNIPNSTLWRGERNIGKGLPLGNLTSQLLVNVYMNEFDQFVKHTLKAKHYIRYADDFVLLSHDKQYLKSSLPYIKLFLPERLRLELHPDKVSTQTLASGVDFLGWVHFPDHRVLRTSTKRKMLRNLSDDAQGAKVVSYRGLLAHGNARKLAAIMDRL